jgi:uncharacterized membrane protein
MTSINAKTTDTNTQQPSRSTGFRRAILRGLGVVLPPLLTIVVLIWAWTTIESYVLTPIETKLRQAIGWNVEHTLTEVPAGAKPTVTTRPSDGFTHNGVRFLPDPTGRLFIPESVKRKVDENLGYFGAFTAAPASADAYWHRYVQMTYLQRRYVVPVFLVVFTTVLYFLGKILTVGLGRWLIHRTEGAILQIPLINKVYGGVKQVTDLAFSSRDSVSKRGNLVVGLCHQQQLSRIGRRYGRTDADVVDAHQPDADDRIHRQCQASRCSRYEHHH